MKINSQNFKAAADAAHTAVRKNGWAECRLPIGEADGVTFVLVAMDEREAYHRNIQTPQQEHEVVGS